MDPERALVSKLAMTGQIETVVGMGIRESHFYDQECANVWRSIAEHSQRWRTPPSFSTIRELNPDFLFEIENDSLEFIVDKFIRETKRRAAMDSVRHLATLCDDPDSVREIDAHFLDAARELALLVPSERIGKFNEMKQRIMSYFNAQFTAGYRGIPSGIPGVDNRTQGWQQRDFITFAGGPGVGKSTLGQICAYNAYLAGATPMLISLEMDQEALFRRWDAMSAQLQTQRIKAGELSNEDMERWQKAADRAEKAQQNIIVIDDLSTCTVATAYAQAVRYAPDLVIIDYISLMEGRAGNGKRPLWEVVTEISKGIKASARTLKIPHIGLAQTNREGGQTGATKFNLAYSQSLIQDSDVSIGLHQDEEMQKEKRMELRLNKVRDGASAVVQMFWDPENMRFEPWADHMKFGNPHVAPPLG